MKILKDEINSLRKTPEVLAKGYGVIPLSIPGSALIKVGEILGQKSYRVSLNINHETKKMTLCFIQNDEPHDSVELIMEVPEDLPEIISSVERSEVNIASKEGMHWHFQHTYVRGAAARNSELAILLSYDSLYFYGRRVRSGDNDTVFFYGGNTDHPFYNSRGNVESPLVNATGGVTTFDANNGYHSKPMAKVSFVNMAHAKSLLSKAGRSKPQGDLLLYFGEKGVLASGVNSEGQETLPLQNAGTIKQIKEYHRSDESSERILRASFPYAKMFDIFFTTRRKNQSPTNFSYGVDETGATVVEADYPGFQGKGTYTLRYVMRGTPASVLDEMPDPDMSITDLTGQEAVQRQTKQKKVSKEVKTPTETTDSEIQEPSIDGPYDERTNQALVEWFEAYKRQQTTRGRSSLGGSVTEHFNAFLMEKVQAGEPVPPHHYEIYNEVK